MLRFDAGAARDASAFLFHPGQPVEENEDFKLQAVLVLESECPTDLITVKNMLGIAVKAGVTPQS